MYLLETMVHVGIYQLNYAFGIFSNSCSFIENIINIIKLINVNISVNSEKTT